MRTKKRPRPLCSRRQRRIFLGSRTTTRSRRMQRWPTPTAERRCLSLFSDPSSLPCTPRHVYSRPRLCFYAYSGLPASLSLDSVDINVPLPRSELKRAPGSAVSPSCRSGTLLVPSRLEAVDGGPVAFSWPLNDPRSLLQTHHGLPQPCRMQRPLGSRTHRTSHARRLWLSGSQPLSCNLGRDLPPSTPRSAEAAAREVRS